MESRRAWTWLALVALLSIFADQFGLGRTPGFGWKQTLGLVIGVVLVVLALWRMRMR